MQRAAATDRGEPGTERLSTMARLLSPRAALLVAALITTLGVLLAPAAPALAIPGNPIRVTGGGWIPVGLTSKATFGFQVRQLPGEPTIPGNPIRGTFEYHNHVTGVRLHSNQIDTLFAADRVATFGGWARVAGQAELVRFEVNVTEDDGEEEGATFSLVSPVDTLAGPVRGGNIRISGATVITLH